MRYTITHITTFSYAAPMRYARCNLRLKPFDWAGQTLRDFAITVDPHESMMRGSKVSGFPGKVERIVVDKPTTALVITSKAGLVVDR
ncbi:MAG: transglutaminase family protein, partial [Sphingomonadaceae bacterium]|nr:transglutaminase family protein [Sphingomonadaceae bacterium]